MIISIVKKVVYYLPIRYHSYRKLLLGTLRKKGTNITIYLPGCWLFCVCCSYFVSCVLVCVCTWSVTNRSKISTPHIISTTQQHLFDCTLPPLFCELRPCRLMLQPLVVEDGSSSHLSITQQQQHQLVPLPLQPQQRSRRSMKKIMVGSWTTMKY